MSIGSVNVGESLWNRKRVCEVLKRQNWDTSEGYERVKYQLEEKQVFLHPIDTSYFNMMEGRVRQRAFWMSIVPDFCNEDSLGLARLSVRIVEKHSDQMATTLHISIFVSYLSHAVIFNFSMDYETWQLESEQSFVASLNFWTQKREGIWDASISDLLELVFLYRAYQVLVPAESI